MLLVTGGAGFIGSNVVAGFNEAGRTDIAVNDMLGADAKWRNLGKHQIADFIPPADLFRWLDGRKLDGDLGIKGYGDPQLVVEEEVERHGVRALPLELVAVERLHRELQVLAGELVLAAFDGDADRVVMVDEKGHLIDGDQLLAVVAESWKDDGRLARPGIVATVMSNLGLERRLTGIGLSLARTAVGDRYVLEHMREHGFNVGGEPSGHLILSDYTTTGDGLLALYGLYAKDPTTGPAEALRGAREMLVRLDQLNRRLTGELPRLCRRVESDRVGFDFGGGFEAERRVFVTLLAHRFLGFAVELSGFRGPRILFVGIG